MFKEIMSYINVVMKRINKNIILSLKNKDKNINFELNNDLYNHFKTLNPMQQEIIKQTMQLKYLESNFNPELELKLKKIFKESSIIQNGDLIKLALNLSRTD